MGLAGKIIDWFTLGWTKNVTWTWRTMTNDKERTDNMTKEFEVTWKTWWHLYLQALYFASRETYSIHERKHGIFFRNYPSIKCLINTEIVWMQYYLGESFIGKVQLVICLLDPWSAESTISAAWRKYSRNYSKGHPFLFNCELKRWQLRRRCPTNNGGSHSDNYWQMDSDWKISPFGGLILEFCAHLPTWKNNWQ